MATTTTVSAIIVLLSVAVMFISATAYGSYEVAPAKKSEIPYKTKEQEIPKTIEVQGLIYCKSGSKVIPLKGAIARITCLARNHNGLELAPFHVSSCPADDKGYFLAKLSPPSSSYLKNAEWRLKECKAYLEKSPMKECMIPLDINGGVTGARVFASSAHRLVQNANLYSVKPFYYTSEKTKPASGNKGY